VGVFSPFCVVRRGFVGERGGAPTLEEGALVGYAIDKQGNPPGLIGESVGGEYHERIFLGAGDGGFRACVFHDLRRTENFRMTMPATLTPSTLVRIQVPQPQNLSIPLRIRS
jgi:hypothetical protein